MENSSLQLDNDIKNGADDISAEFKAKLKACDPEIQSVVSEQKKAIHKLQQRVGKYEVKIQMLRDENEILKKERDEQKIIVTRKDYENAGKKIEDLEREIKENNEKLGIG